MRRPGAGSVVVAAAAAVTTGGIVLAANGFSNSSSTSGPAAAASPTSPTATIEPSAPTTGSASTAPGDLSAADLRTAAAMGWEIDPAGPAPDAAQRAAVLETFQPQARSHVRALSLVRITVRHYGAPKDPSIEDPTEDQLVLKIKDRRLWVVVLGGVEIPSRGPSGRRGPTTGRSDVAILIDPGTLKTVIGETFTSEI